MPQDTVPDAGEITRLLRELAEEGRQGSASTLDRLMPLVYGELKLLARSKRGRRRSAVDPGTTSLVHEAYARLARADGIRFENRRQFFCIASKAMRSILVDNARWHQRLKRGGTDSPVPLDEETLVSAGRGEELLALDEALTRLESERPTLGSVVECRCFGGLTVEETAEALEISAATVKRRWTLARAWLHRELRPAAL
ncbi:MAG: ECF-type sigma factor [Thermoanaerobaculia bacterium]